MFSPTTKEAANFTKDSAAHDLKNGISQAKREAGNVKDETVHTLSSYANEAGRKVRSLIDNAEESFSHATDRVGSEIRSNPVRSSLIALGAGFILGVLMRR